MVENLSLYQKTYDLYLYTHKFIRKFPKAERYQISLSLQSSLLDALKLIVRANLKKSKEEKSKLQDEIEAYLYVYLTSLRLSKEMKMLPVKKYAYASKLCNELIKILYGWKKMK